MSTPARAHRASAQRRRAMLIDAAGALASEVGAGAVTHRGVATRAGVPLSTTSYFFDSIDDLVHEALRQVVHDRVQAFDAAERAFVLSDGGLSAALEAAVDAIVGQDPVGEAGQVEAYLAAARSPELRSDVSETMSRYVARVQWQLQRIGSVRSDELAWAVVALLDGALVQRIAQVSEDHRTGLRNGLRALLAAAVLEDEEVDALLGRYGDQPEVNGPLATDEGSTSA